MNETGRRSWHLSGALDSPAYRNFLVGNILAQTAFWSQRVVTGWIAWELTQSPFWLGVVAVSDLLPVLVMGRSRAPWPTGTTS